MAHFIVSTNNSRGREVTASEPSNAHIRGWNAGVNVEARVENGRDVFYVWMTRGSSGSQYASLLGKVKETPSGPVFEEEK